ncbi:hypothetical protein KJ840_03045 [Patescibacteria group bacterium]|nr:hypothetical protein [Patescibacteria group bacterium]
MFHNHSFWHYLIQKKLSFAGLIALFLLLGMLITVVQPFEYSASASVLVIHKINPNLDAYTAARAAEKLSRNLASIIYTSSFLDTIASSYLNYPLNLPAAESAKRKAWRKKIAATVSPETSILKITAYDKNPQEAEKLVFLVANTLVTRGKEYHGGGEDIVIKLIDKPMTSKYPARPRVVLNLISALFLGIIFSYLIHFKKYYQRQHR